MNKIITHTDMDGIGCEIVLESMIRGTLDVSHCSYSTVSNVIKTVVKNHDLYNKIYVTDLSIKEDDAELLNTICEKVIFVDHHKSSAFMKKYNWATVDINENILGKQCATSILVSMLENPSKELIAFADAVRKYDTWEWKSLEDNFPCELNKLFYLKGKESFKRSILLKIKSKKSLIDDSDKELIKNDTDTMNKYIKKKSKKVYKTKIGEYEVGIIFAESYVSELGNALCEIHDDIDYIMIIDKKKVSLRTIKEIDLSKIAEGYGGGGHPKSAGYNVFKSFRIFFLKLFSKK